MAYNKSTVIPNDASRDVLLRCGNLRIAFLALDIMFWMFTLVFLCQMASSSSNPHLAEHARRINDFFGHSVVAFMIGPVIILATLVYFIYGRKTFTWRYEGALIDDKPIQVAYYRFKRLTASLHLIYLQSGGRLWILYPVTSQDGRKFPDVKIMQRETAANEAQVELLKNKLTNAGAMEKSFWFFTTDVILSFILLVLIVTVAFLYT